jgi:tetratricopeptide (TPR) repeat protein
MDEAKNLLLQGKAAESMALLEKSLPDNLQDPEYNYLLGISALDAGKPGEAVFAFERTLALKPDHPQARAELARALIALGEFEAARNELAQVRQMSIPPEVASRVNELLAQLDQALAEQALGGGRPTAAFGAYVEGEFGYDSNINTAPGLTSVFIPILGIPGTLNGFATARASGLLGLNGGVYGQTKIDQDVDLYGSLDARFRYYWDQDQFLPGALSGNVGVRINSGTDHYSVGVTKFDYYIGQYHNDDQSSFYGQWQRELSRQDMVSVFGQVIRANHPITPYLNTTLYLGGAGWTHAYLSPGEPIVSVTAFYGNDRERNDDPTVGRNFWGVKMGGEYKLQDNLKVIGGVTAQYGRYGGESVWFGHKRIDYRYDMNLGVAYRPERNWTVTPQITYTRNDSNIAFDDFDRKQYVVAVRRDFF